MFLRKNWYWLLTLLVVIGIFGFIILKPKAPVTETKIFKVPDANQVRKNISDNRVKRTTEQGVKEKTETPVVESKVSNEAFTETQTESQTDSIPLGDEDVISTETETEDWRAGDYGESLFGFGPYPEIPSDFPEKYRPIWSHGVYDAINFAEFPEEFKVVRQAEELMDRVRVKLWKEGRTDITSISLDPTTNRVYPLTANSIVVRYAGTGTEKRIFSTSTDANFPQDLRKRIRKGEKPPGIQIIDADTGGFNVYEYLGL